MPRSREFLPHEFLEARTLVVTSAQIDVVAHLKIWEQLKWLQGH
jgi:hypothetical protein